MGISPRRGATSRNCKLVILTTLVAAGCAPSDPTGASSGATDDESSTGQCDPGWEGCPCVEPNGLCLGDLECTAGVCLPPSGASTGETDSSEMTLPESESSTETSGGDDCPEEMVIQGTVEVFNSVELAELSGVTEITGALGISAEGITSLAPLSCLKLVGEGVSISNISTLTSLAGLESLEAVGELSLTDLPQLSTLEGLSSLSYIDGVLSLSNVAVADLVGLESLQTALRMNIAMCGTLQSVEGISPNIMVDALALSGNPQLEDLSAFDGATLAGLSIRDCPLLSSLPAVQVTGTPIPELFDLTGLYLSDLPLVTDLGGLTVGSSLYALEIVDVPQLVSLAGLENLVSVTSRAELVNLPAVTSIVPLAELTSVGSYLYIMNVGMATLSAMDSVATVGGDFFLQGNQNLVDVSALHTLDVLGQFVVIQSNPLLDQCDAEALGQALVDNGFAGSLTVENNAGSCP